jgi:hypothetical protein
MYKLYAITWGKGGVLFLISPRSSVADPDNFDEDPDPTSEKNRIRILLYVKFYNKKFSRKKLRIRLIYELKS